MSQSYFDHNQNLQIHGDVNFISGGGSRQGDTNSVQVSPEVQATNARSEILQRGFDILCQNATPTALYGSSQSAKGDGCHHGTRRNVQDHIFKWLDDPESEVAMWMYGPAGIGKTAIAQTVAKSCAERGQLSSSFFFFRSDEGRNCAKYLVPTLAYAMVQQMPHTRDVVCPPTATNPHIFSTPLEDQIRTIIIPSLSAPFPPSPITPGPMLLIIDGLDECIDTGMQLSIIELFVSLLAKTTTTVRHKILIVSRPESHIVSTFSAVDLSSHVHHLCLEGWKSIDDIEIYLRAELDVVKQTHPLKLCLAAQWPSDDSFRGLLHKAFESFAYASSAIRYISSHDRHPETSLKTLLGLSQNYACEAHAELDLLYRHILANLDEQIRNTVLKILCLHYMFELSDIKSIGSILGAETSMLELAIIKMSSVIHFDRYSMSFSYYHTSFSDFLLDKTRSGALHLYSPSVLTAVLTKLITRPWTIPYGYLGDGFMRWYDSLPRCEAPGRPHDYI